MTTTKQILEQTTSHAAAGKGSNYGKEPIDLPYGRFPGNHFRKWIEDLQALIDRKVRARLVALLFLKPLNQSRLLLRSLHQKFLVKEYYASVKDRRI